MTKAELINELAISTGYDKRTISVIVEGFMDTVKNQLAEDNDVFLRGFGSFVCKHRAAKTARDINRCISVDVPAHRVVHFKPAKDFSAKVR